MDKKNIRIIAILLILTVSFVFYRVFLRNDISDLAELRSRKASIQDAIKRNKLILDTQRNRADNVKQLEDDIAAHKLLFLDENKVPFFLNYVSSIARRNSVVIKSIEPGQTESGDMLTKTTFTTEIRGGFPDIYKFLYHLEDDWRAVKVEAISIDKDHEDSSVNVRLTLVVVSINGYSVNS